MSQWQFNQGISTGGRMEIIFRPDGSGAFFEGDWANPDVLFYGQGHTVTFNWHIMGDLLYMNFCGNRGEYPIEFSLDNGRFGPLTIHLWADITFTRFN